MSPLILLYVSIPLFLILRFSFFIISSSLIIDQFSGAFFGVGPQIRSGALGVSLQTGYAGKSENTDVTNQGRKNYASINKDTSVHTYLEAINPLYSYKVQPYVVCKKFSFSLGSLIIISL